MGAPGDPGPVGEPDEAAEDTAAEDGAADALPTGRLIRAGKAASAVGPSSVRFFTTLATNAMRSPDDAYDLLLRRHEEIADNTLSVLGELRGGALKIGQLASFVDVDLIPPEFRTVYQEKLADLRDSAPPMSWKKIKRVLEGEWDEPVESLFEHFEHDAVAAASIGQVHRAVLPDGRKVAVKIQYPEIADALEADLGTAQGLTAIATPLAKAMMPGLDPRMLIGEIRELVLEELDYELEAQHQRTFARAYRGHPFIYVPDVVTSLSRRRVMVSDWVDGMRFPEIQKLPEAERDRIGEIIMRFYFHSMDYVGRFNTDSHPGNFLLREDGSVAFIDFGNVKVCSPEWLRDGNRAMRAVIDGDKEAFIDAVVDLGYVRRREHLDADHRPGDGPEVPLPRDPRGARPQGAGGGGLVSPRRDRRVRGAGSAAGGRQLAPDRARDDLWRSPGDAARRAGARVLRQQRDEAPHRGLSATVATPGPTTRSRRWRIT
jgi:predicted unusual protein kinase regulating ubiquinone biosynthesis (AarF/ABC1/UbiB family)